MFSNQDTKFDNFCQQIENNLRESIQKYPEWRDEFIIDRKEQTLVQMDLNLDKMNKMFLLSYCKNYDNINKAHEQISKLVTNDEKKLKADIIDYRQQKLISFINTHTITVKITPNINWRAFEKLED